MLCRLQDLGRCFAVYGMERASEGLPWKLEPEHSVAADRQREGKCWL
jgi:hypothetical protein